MRLRQVLTHLIVVGLGFLGGMWAIQDRPVVQGPTGVLEHDDRADPGVVLIPRLGSLDREPGRELAVAIDKSGKVLHEWQLPYAIAGHAELLEDRGLIYVGVHPHVEQGLPGAAGAVVRVDRSGKEVRSHADPLLHHDFDVLPDGTVAFLRWSELDDPEAVQGGIADTEHDGKMFGDEIVEAAEDGSERVVWNAADTLDPETDRIPAYLNRGEWTHANSLEYVPSDPLTGQEAYLVSFRQLSLIMLISRDGEEIWRYGGEGVLHQQHDPTLLDDGRVLVFDNGQYRYGEISSSEVVEVDPATGETEVVYAGTGVGGWSFYSSVMSGAQRLPNGNTLMTESLPGRLTEVTPDGEVVWRYVSPYAEPDRTGGMSRAIFKARSYPSLDW